MIAPRTALRSSRAIRAQQFRRVNRIQNVRYQSTQSGSGEATSFHPALTGGIAGGVCALAAVYGWYHFSGAKQVVKASNQTKQYIDSVQKKFKEATPEPNEALRWLRQTATYYAGFVPGASGYVNTAFDDLDKIREKHGDEVDQIVRDAWDELRGVAKEGSADLNTAKRAWDILYKHLQRVGELAADAAEDIMNNHPQLKEKLGGNLDQLKAMGDKYGPEAKKQVDDTWKQIQDIVKAGISAETITKIKKLVDEKVEVVKKMADEAWKNGMEQAKPYLEKNPEVKKLVEENADALKQGNVQELFERIKKAVESGNTEDIQNYIQSVTDKAKKSGMGNLQKYLDKVPGGSEILPKLSQLQDVAQKHGKEAEKLMKETIDEISKVLSKKSEEAKKLAEKAEKEAK